VRQGDEWVRAPDVQFDFEKNWVYLERAESQMDPMRIARVIGAHIAETIRPYRFSQPPRALVSGHVPVIGRTDTADMEFQLDGGPFHYWRFNVPRLQARVLWQGDFLTVTNLHSTNFYGGELTGDLAFDFTPKGRADYQFYTRFQNVNLHEFLLDVTPPTNRLEGRVSGGLNITYASTADWDSWQGHTVISMRDGFLWDFPMFGVFTPILNTIAPGLGTGRATAAAAKGMIKNSIISTDDLVIDAPPVRLLYRGTVNFRGEVNARVEAEMLRRTPLIGPLLRLAFSPLTKIFEYRVTGTLAEPKTAPLYIPKFIDSLLHPFRTLKRLAPPEPEPVTAPEPSAAQDAAVHRSDMTLRED
jgi:hypothetical protein